LSVGVSSSKLSVGISSSQLSVGYHPPICQWGYYANMNMMYVNCNLRNKQKVKLQKKNDFFV
jgi:hypothetical protein